tara:strand:+ start:2473 stop:4653 length:2181 start_codon:yes stop_codon:yes gene_type:complete
MATKKNSNITISSNMIKRLEVNEFNQLTDLENYSKALKGSNDPYFGTLQRKKLINLLSDPEFQTHGSKITIRQLLSFDYLRFGEYEKSIELLEEALTIESANVAETSYLLELLEDLSITYIKSAELINQSDKSSKLVCTLPISNQRGYSNNEYTYSAINYLNKWLEIEPNNIKARWLLNIAHMTLGNYPDSIDDKLLIEVNNKSNLNLEKFSDISSEVGIIDINLSGGSIIDDFDNDGYFDIVTSTWNPDESLIFYHNKGNGIFAKLTLDANLDDQLGGLNINHADFNNDGLIDIFVMRGGWMRNNGQMRVSLLKNMGNNIFNDVTKESKLNFPSYPSQNSAWGDYDNDGDLDLYACNESEPDDDFDTTSFKYPSQLFQNNGDETFTDISGKANVKNFGYCKGSSWGDYDNDGDLDLYISNFASENRLYKNNGNGTFTDIAKDLKIQHPISSFTTWFWDYNNDGWLDIFVAGYGSDVKDVASSYLGIEHNGTSMKLYKNDQSGGFIDITENANLNNIHLTMAANYGDFNNDGWLDIYLGTGYPSYDVITPNIAYLNNQGNDFIDVTFELGLGQLHKGHGISFGDIDRDGDQDIFTQIGGFYPGDGFYNFLYKNHHKENNWISIKLQGSNSNSQGIGTRIKVITLTKNNTLEEIYSTVSSGGSFGSSTFEQHIGIGSSKEIKEIHINWPASSKLQIFKNVPINRSILIEEDRQDYTIRDIKPINTPN